MIKTTERNIEHENSIRLVEDFKKNNANTIETVKSYDPVLRMWTFKKVKVDENAKKFFESTRPKKEKKTQVLRQPETTKQKAKGINPDSLRSKIYGLYQSGIEKKDIANQLNISTRRVSSEITKRNNLLGVEQAKRINPTREKVRKLMKTESNMTVISKKIGVVRSVIDYHIKKINNGE